MFYLKLSSILYKTKRLLESMQPAASEVEPDRGDLDHFELVGFLGIGVQHVHGTAQSGIEGANDPHDIEWIFDVFDRCANEGLFKRAWSPFIIPG